VHGHWAGGERELRERLHKYVSASGERRVAVHQEGQEALTRAKPIAVGTRCSLLELRLETGRTHQIRVHLAHAGHPIVGDSKYGDFALNRALAREGAARLQLHARRLAFSHPLTHARLRLQSPLPVDMRAFVEREFALRADRL
jgi:23S rRNA pseudouridine955/2504/2580 synthase